MTKLSLKEAEKYVKDQLARIDRVNTKEHLNSIYAVLESRGYHTKEIMLIVQTCIMENIKKLAEGLK